MKFEAFKKIQKNYADCIKKGDCGKNRKGRDIRNQSEWIWFDRKTIEELMAKTDPRTGGLKIYFGQYSEDTTPKLVEDSAISDQSETEDYDGKLTVMLVAASLNEGASDETLIINGGKLCPPNCN